MRADESTCGNVPREEVPTSNRQSRGGAIHASLREHKPAPYAPSVRNSAQRW